MRNIFALTFTLFFCFSSNWAEDGSALWLRYASGAKAEITSKKQSPTLRIAVSELQNFWQGGIPVTLEVRNNKELRALGNEGYVLGFRTFVLQGGEDGGFSDEAIADIVRCIKERYPDCAVTLSFGEHPYETYRLWRMAGADRYLLRHETADRVHYERLHPDSMSYDNRVGCLYDLKSLGYQVGSGFMVGSPYQTPVNLAEDLHFLAKLQPQMIGIGPYVPHKETPFAKMKQGTVRQTLVMISLLRLMFPKALMPSAAIVPRDVVDGRERGFMHGANVVMPNLSPVSVRKKYELYDNKICTGEESAQCRGCLDRRAEAFGFQVVVDRGDPL